MSRETIDQPDQQDADKQDADQQDADQQDADHPVKSRLRFCQPEPRKLVFRT